MMRVITTVLALALSCTAMANINISADWTIGLGAAFFTYDPVTHTLTKSNGGGASSNWDSWAVTDNQFEPDHIARITYTVDNTNTKRAIGIGNAYPLNTAMGLSDLDYAIYIKDNKIRVWENGSFFIIKGSGSSVSVGDDIIIERVENSPGSWVVNYIVDGVSVRSTALANASDAFYGFAMIKDKNASIVDPQAFYYTTSVQTRFNCENSTAGDITLTASGGVPSYTFSWSDGQTSNPAVNLDLGNYSATITDNVGNVLNYSEQLLSDIYWDQVTNANTTVSSITKTTGTPSGGGTFNRIISGSEGFFEFKVSSTTGTKAIGLAQSNSDDLLGSIDFAFQFASSSISIYESGSFVAILTGSLTTDDVFRIEQDAGGNINYLRNEVIVRTVAGPGANLFIDAALTTDGEGFVDMAANFCGFADLPPPAYVTLNKALGGSYSIVTDDQLKIVYEEDYEVGISRKLAYKLFDNGYSKVAEVDQTGAVVIANSPVVDVVFGKNLLDLDLSPLSLSPGFYTLEVVTPKNDKLLLKFKI